MTPAVLLATDQRAYLRADSRCDVGGFEGAGVFLDRVFADGFESGTTTAWSSGFGPR